MGRHQSPPGESYPSSISLTFTFSVAINLILPLCILIGCIDGLDEEEACMAQQGIEAASLHHSSTASKEPALPAIQGYC